MRLAQVLTRIVLPLAVAGALAGCADGSGPEVIGEDGASQSTDEVSQAAEPGSDPANAQDFEVESGFTTSVDSINTRYVLAGARLTNPNADLAAYDVQVLFNLKGANGDVLDSQTEMVPYVAPGEAVPVAPLQIGFDLKVEPTDLEVQVVGEFSEDEGARGQFGGEAALLDVEDARVLPGDYGPEFTARVTNPTDVVAEFASWSCIYLNNKSIVGGSSSSIIDPIPPGSTVEFGEMLTVKITAKDVECRVLTDL